MSGKLKFSNKVVRDLSNPNLRGLREVPIDRGGIDPSYYQEVLEQGGSVGEIRDSEGNLKVLILYHIEHGEMFIVSAISKCKGGKMTTKCLPLIEEYAKQNNCVSVAFGTIRDGLIRETKKIGYRIGEVVMRKEF